MYRVVSSIVLKIEPKLLSLQTIWENVLFEEFYLLGYITV
jgi:hypothetical protein